MPPALTHHDRPFAIFLDIDGTLIDIAPTPQDVVTPRSLAPLLGRLFDVLSGAVAIISGRPVSDVDRLLAPVRLPVAGGHGAEIRLDVGGDITPTADALDASMIAAVLKLGEIDPGIIIEPKGTSIAVHYRLAVVNGAAIEEELRGIVGAHPSQAELRMGRKVVEILPRHVSKGGALKAFMGLAAFDGRRPIMIGDDSTDQSAFESAEQFGGQGFRVAGEYFRPDDADFDSPTHVRQWLSRFVDSRRQ